MRSTEEIFLQAIPTPRGLQSLKATPKAKSHRDPKGSFRLQRKHFELRVKKHVTKGWGNGSVGHTHTHTTNQIVEVID